MKLLWEVRYSFLCGRNCNFTVVVLVTVVVVVVVVTEALVCCSDGVRTRWGTVLPGQVW